MDIIFVRTRYKYDSYTDFWKLVELSQFETCYVDEVDVRKHAVYIFTPFNGEWEPHINNQVGRPRNAHIIHWCLERPSGAGGMGNYARSNRGHIYDRLVDEVWLSDRRMASEAAFRFVILGSDYGLGEPGPSNGRDHRKYDIVHLSYITNRRANIYKNWPADKIGPNRWPWDTNPSRDEVLKLSRFALNIHQDDYPFMEPLRFALFAAYGLPIATEAIYESFPYNEDYVNYSYYDGIVGRLKQMLDNDYSRWYDMGMRCRDYMCRDHRFRDEVLKEVKESVG